MTKWWNSLAFRITLILVLAQIFILFLVGNYYVTQFSDEVHKRIEGRLTLPAEMVEQGMLRPTVFLSLNELSDLVGEHIVLGFLVDPQGELLVGPGSDLAVQTLGELGGQVDLSLFDFENPQPSIMPLEEGGESFLVSVQPVFITQPFSGEQSLRYLSYVKVNTTETQAEIDRIRGSIVLGSIASVAVTSLVIFVVFHFNIFRRIRGLQSVLRRFAGGDMDVRVEDKIAPDEVGAIQRNVNAMIDHISELFDSIKESETRYRLLAENVVDVITQVDERGHYLYASPASQTVLGYAPDELVGKPVAQFVHPDDTDKVQNLLVKPNGSAAITVSYRMQHKEGRYVWMEAAARPLNEAANNGSRMISVARDVTERLEAAEALRHAQAERQQFQEALIETQRQTLRALATPVIPISDGVIILPLIGEIDDERARDIMRKLLQNIARHRAKVVILDITGVEMIDTHVAASLDNTVTAARLKGARTIVTGISDAVAETIVELGIDWSHVETVRDLQTGLRHAISWLNERSQ